MKIHRKLWKHPALEVAPVKTTFQKKQDLAAPSRYYGDGGTIHGTNHLDVEIGPDGHVVAVWFRCAMLPFIEHQVDVTRAGDLTGATQGVKITGVELLDEQEQ